MTLNRVVSLVPSVTETLFDLDLGHKVIGRTDYCVHPAGQVEGLPSVGGTKNVRVADVIALNPDLVIANREENSRADIEALQAAGAPVWVTFPKTVRDALDLMHDIIHRFNVPHQELRIVALEKAYEWATMAAANSETPAPRAFCPIWRDAAETPAWWMTINGDTYGSNVIAVCGGQNVFADRDRRYPLAADLDPNFPQASNLREVSSRDARYPRVTLDEILAARPEVILLPSEPYPFSEADADFWRQFSDLPAARSNRIHLVDGSLLTWPGTRLARALQELPSLFI